MKCGPGTACGMGGRFNILTIIDGFARISKFVLACRPIPTKATVTEFIDQRGNVYGYPKRIRVDNGPEFTSVLFDQ